jgi:hypothetical protein
VISVGRLKPALAIAIAAVVAGYTNALAQTLVSGPSPYASCGVGATAGATNYPNAEVEPQIAVNPVNHSNLVGVWQQDRWSNGGAHGLVAGTSVDGGLTWAETILPFSFCAASAVPYPRASDPWVSIGPDGIVYAVALAVDESNGNSAVLASKSTDGGKTWSPAVTIKADLGGIGFNDKEAVTADPVDPRVAYVVWDRFNGPAADIDKRTPQSGAAWFARTTNGGKTWKKPHSIPGTISTVGNQIVVDPRTDTLYDFFTGPSGITFVKSMNQGKTWTAPETVSNFVFGPVADPNDKTKMVRAPGFALEAAVDNTTGQLYVAWGDGRFNGYNEVALATSTDGGASWKGPFRISTPFSGIPAFTPTVKVNSSGTIGVTYYDFRTLVPGNISTLPTDYWLKTFTPAQLAGGNVDTAVIDTHIGGPFNMFAAPTAGGYFVGDYQGLATIGAAFHAFFVQTNCADNSCDAASGGSNPTDVYFK